MSTGGLSVVRIQSNATYIFAADSARGRVPFVQDLGVSFAQEMSLVDLSIVPGDRTVWIGRQGTLKFSDARTIVITSIAGGAHELMVGVEGSTEDAVDVLNEVWSKLGELARESAIALTDAPGAFTYQTTAIVRLPRSFRDVMPLLATLYDYAREALGETLLDRPGVMPFRVELPLTIGARGVSVSRSIVIEPRFTSTDDDQVFFTVSPLRSGAHLEMLRKALVE